jgi:hypothetical protein
LGLQLNPSATATAAQPAPLAVVVPLLNVRDMAILSLSSFDDNVSIGQEDHFLRAQKQAKVR